MQFALTILYNLGFPMNLRLVLQPSNLYRTSLCSKLATIYEMNRALVLILFTLVTKLLIFSSLAP